MSFYMFCFNVEGYCCSLHSLRVHSLAIISNTQCTKWATYKVLSKSPVFYKTVNVRCKLRFRWQINIQVTTFRTRLGDIVSLRRIPKCKNRVVIYAIFTSEWKVWISCSWSLTSIPLLKFTKGTQQIAAVAWIHSWSSHQCTSEKQCGARHFYREALTQFLSITDKCLAF